MRNHATRSRDWLKALRRRGSSEPTGVALVAEEALDEPCRAAGCANQASSRCAYVDREQFACATAWCDKHITLVLDLPYCRRHASVALSLSNGFFTHMLPEVGNRAPSLVKWVGSELDAGIRAALTDATLDWNKRVIQSPVRPAFPDFGTRRWQMSWSLVNSARVLRTVSIEVAEADDCEVGVRVGDRLLGRQRPPWIGRGPKAVSPGDDAASRQAFREAMLRAVEVGLSRDPVPSVPAGRVTRRKKRIAS